MVNFHATAFEVTLQSRRWRDGECARMLVQDSTKLNSADYMMV